MSQQPPSVLENPAYTFEYTDDVSTLTNIVTRTVGAYKDVAGTPQDLVVGATSNLRLEAVADVVIRGNNSVIVEPPLIVQNSVRVDSNVVSRGDIYGSQLGVYRLATSSSNTQQVGYTWIINDNDELELIKYSYFAGSSNAVCKRVGVFGLAKLMSLDASDVVHNPLLLAPQQSLVPDTSGMFRERSIINPYYNTMHQLGVYFATDGTHYYTTMTTWGETVQLYIDRLGQQKVTLPAFGRFVARRSIADDTLDGLILVGSPNLTAPYTNWTGVDVTPLPNGECLMGFRIPYNTGTTAAVQDCLSDSKPVLASIPADSVLFIVHATSTFSVKATYYISAAESNVVSGKPPKYDFLPGMRYYPENNKILIQMLVQNKNADVNLYWGIPGGSSDLIATVSSSMADAAVTFLVDATLDSDSVVSALDFNRAYKVPMAGNIDFIYDDWGSGAPVLPTSASASYIDILYYITVSASDISSGIPDTVVYDGFNTVLLTIPATNSQDAVDSYWLQNVVTRIDTANGDVADAYVVEAINASGSRADTTFQGYKTCMLNDGSSVALIGCSPTTANLRLTIAGVSEPDLIAVAQGSGDWHSILYNRDAANNIAWSIEVYNNTGPNYAFPSMAHGRQVLEVCPDGGFIMSVVVWCGANGTVYIRDATDTTTSAAFPGTDGYAVIKFSSSGQYQWVCFVSNITGYIYATATSDEIYILGVMPNAVVRDAHGTSYTIPNDQTSHIVLTSAGVLLPPA